MPADAMNVCEKADRRPSFCELPVDGLRPHPSYVRHHCVTNLRKLSRLEKLGDRAFLDPLSVTAEGIIIDGYARYHLARRRNRATLPCFVHSVHDDDALCALIRAQSKSSGLNDYLRIVLALDLESSFQEKARVNQQKGGRDKGSSSLTDDERIDVREEMAKIAGVSAGNVTKVKQIRAAAITEIKQAVAEGEASIHRAWVWSKFSPDMQKQALQTYRELKGMRNTVRRLLKEHVAARAAYVTDLTALVAGLSRLGSDSQLVNVMVVSAPGRAIWVSDELANDLVTQGELG